MRSTLPRALHHLLSTVALSVPPRGRGALRIVSTAPRAEGKCTFVGHAARATSLSEALQAVQSILGLKKVSKASHNILAYRFSPVPPTTPSLPPSVPTSTPLAGFDNDGESPAGARLLRILEMREERDVLVVVRRWYGGSPLGNRRFRAIDAAGREALDLLKVLDEAGKGGVASEPLAAEKQRKGKRRRSR